MRVAKGTFYWLLAGALLGFGLMSAFSVSIPIFLLGTVLALYRVAGVGGRGFWMVLVGMGMVPSLHLTLTYWFADRSTTLYPDNWWKGVLVFVAPLC